MRAVRLNTVQRGSPFEILVDGRPILAYEGEMLATVLMAAGIRNFSQIDEGVPSKRLFCGMGTCYQCLVTINGRPGYQACRTLVNPGMIVETRS